MIFHQFTYGPDSAKSIVSLKSIRRAYPDAPIYLWSDKANPIDPSLDYGPGVIVRETLFRRLGNLNGPECVLGMMECYATGYAEHPEETHHVKFDPDSLLLGTTKLDVMVAENVYFFCPAFNRISIYGWFQLQSREMLEEFMAIPEIRLFVHHPSWAEDMIFHEAATKLANGRKIYDYHIPESAARCSYFTDGIDSPVDHFGSEAVIFFPNRRGHPKTPLGEVMSTFYSEFLESL